MKKLTTQSGVFGPYQNIEVLSDRYRCDGADLPFCVVGDGNISDANAEDMLPPSTERNLEEERLLKFSAINAKAQELLAPYAADYPQGEVYSWPTQVAEAEAFDADPQSPTPLLSGISAQRGTTVAHLVTRVKVKASAYATIIGPIIGKRQYFEDLALSAATVEELDEIDITTGWPT